jgi:glycyl-tRNA synthetase beta chain
MKSFLLEIGTEEIPARFVRTGLKLLRDEVSALLKDSFIEHGSIQGYATPRRLALLIEEVVENQKDRVVESMGPPRSIAYDASGAPTKAAAGFARSLHIDVGDLKIVKTDRGEYVSATVEEKGRTTEDVLAESIPKLISGLQLPKSMRWGDGTLRFYRPIHWIVALFGENIIPFELEGIKSSNFTYGHRFLSPAAIPLKKPEDYISNLSLSHVMADIDTRKNKISDQIAMIESDKGCIVHKDEELLDTVTNLVEYPTAVVGSFDEKYLDLPKALPVTVMRTHQKYFSTENSTGGLLPYFVIISNTTPENSETVRRGAEKVLRARLEDARFYFSDDKQKPFADYVEDLKKVTFQEKLGSLFDKTGRVVELCSFIADCLNIEKKEDILRTARLAKADLVTGVVSEFPELQGYMGMIYAMNSGESGEVASAIHEHYLPKSAGDSLPSGNIAPVVSLADRIDNIASFFYLGLVPTGSEDPFALRRQAVGIINIILGKGFLISINELIENALLRLEQSADKRKDITSQVLQFFNQRLEGILLGQGYSHDLISAVLSSDHLEVKGHLSRIEILASLKKEPAFPGLLISAKRVCNILSKTGHHQLKESLLSDRSEQDLLNASQRVGEMLKSSEYSALYDLSYPINTFFDKVLVMDKDPDIRDNRLALLQKVKALFDELGDFSKILEE